MPDQVKWMEPVCYYRKKDKKETGFVLIKTEYIYREMIALLFWIYKLRKKTMILSEKHFDH